MARLTLPEMAKRLGVAPPSLYVQASRKKINILEFKESDGKIRKYIDDTDPFNLIFLRKYAAYRNVSESPIPETNISEMSVKKVDSSSKKEKCVSAVVEGKNQKQTIEAYGSTGSTLDELKAEKIQEEIELLKIKKQRAQGDVIPFDITKNAFNITISTLTTSFYNALDNEVNLIGQILKADKTIMSEAKKRIRDTINNEVKNAKKIAKKELKSIVDEYSKSGV